MRIKPHERGGVGGKKPYRKRCMDCGKMFNAKHAYEIRCPQCEKLNIMAISKLGM